MAVKAVKTTHVHVRVGSNGVITAVTDEDIEAGTDLDTAWNEGSEVAYYDARISVTATLPAERGEPAVAATVSLDAPPAPNGILTAEVA